MRVSLSLIVLANTQWFSVTGFSVHTSGFPLRECRPLSSSHPSHFSAHPTRAHRLPRLWACANDMKAKSDPPWRHAVSTREWDSDYIEAVANLRSSEHGDDPRMAYLTELDKAAKGRSRCIVSVLPVELLRESGIELPLPNRETSQELQNLFEMVTMGMMTEEAYHEAEQQKRAAAQTGSVVVGAVDLTLYTLPEHTRTTAYLSNMVVRKECRGAGIGAELLTQGEAMGRDAGALEATLHVHEANTLAVRLYERGGFVREEREQEGAAHARSIQALIDADLSDPGHKLYKKTMDTLQRVT